jgi:hypothetical protein
MALLSAAIGEVRAGIDLLDEALAEIDRSGHRWCQGELWRLKTELRARAPLAERPHSREAHCSL